ncbi:uncharacterized protein FOMMEDRAFT_142664 [Fomitiporia mediterranea MF3/22]|uniref:uncharacterized protein n=1 Tax=Fomitiporia mediterranea (strain MF3/22) TaxID=694068 RepID=UPI0004407830|nr:uncharacterized protein FOMMEDRAFT_142664 [Fomitiporia mediterranea MF3/22]EJC99695.1 hypothetical protein FOMMEDRAFT_142664 [Fomitiporia mediterranea MF3/22]
MPMSSKKTASRKYIDLIKYSSNKWANWDPSNPVEAGDYGGVNKESGEFERQGNLYRDSTIAEITARYPPIYNSETTDYQYHSLNTRTTKLKAQFNPDIFGDSKPLVGGQWHFSNRRGAILLMHRTKLTRVPEELLEEIKESEWVKGKYIVTHVHTCPAYAMYLSDKSICVPSVSEFSNLIMYFYTVQGSVSIGLCSDPFSPGDAGSDKSGGEKPLKWITEGLSGFYQSASSDESNFVPLFQIKVVQKREGKRRQSPDPINDEKLEFYNVEVPWYDLDEEGEELPDDLSEMDDDD